MRAKGYVTFFLFIVFSFTKYDVSLIYLYRDKYNNFDCRITDDTSLQIITSILYLEKNF